MRRAHPECRIERSDLVRLNIRRRRRRVALRGCPRGPFCRVPEIGQTDAARVEQDMSNSFAPPAPKPAPAPGATFDPTSVAETGAAGNGAGLPLVLKGGLLDTPDDEHERQAQRVATKVTQNSTPTPTTGAAESSMPVAGTPLPGDVRGRIEGVLG